MKTTITRRTALAAPITLPLLPVSAYATPAEDGPDLLAMLDDLAALPPEPRELSIRIIRLLAEKYRKDRGVPS